MVFGNDEMLCVVTTANYMDLALYADEWRAFASVNWHHLVIDNGVINQIKSPDEIVVIINVAEFIAFVINAAMIVTRERVRVSHIQNGLSICFDIDLDIGDIWLQWSRLHRNEFVIV